MIVGLSIRNFKAIQEVAGLSLGAFHVLVGPNGIGKTTLLDAVDFVRDCLTRGPAAAVESRHIADFNDLTWMRQGGIIEIDLWLDLSSQRPELTDSLLNYPLAVRQDSNVGVCIHEESLKQYQKSRIRLGDRIQVSPNIKPKRLLGKTPKGTDFYSRETSTYQDSFNFGTDKLTLALTPPDDERYPTANAVRRFLMRGIRYIQLNSPAMRLPCPATRPADLDLDGTNLARVVGKLMGANGGLGPYWAAPETQVARWANHLRYALPDLTDIGWSRRQADNAEYLLLRYESGLEAQLGPERRNLAHDGPNHPSLPPSRRLSLYDRRAGKRRSSQGSGNHPALPLIHSRITNAAGDSFPVRRPTMRHPAIALF